MDVSFYCWSASAPVDVGYFLPPNSNDRAIRNENKSIPCLFNINIKSIAVLPFLPPFSAFPPPPDFASPFAAAPGAAAPFFCETDGKGLVLLLSLIRRIGWMERCNDACITVANNIPAPGICASTQQFWKRTKIDGPLL